MILVLDWSVVGDGDDEADAVAVVEGLVEVASCARTFVIWSNVRSSGIQLGLLGYFLLTILTAAPGSVAVLRCCCDVQGF